MTHATRSDSPDRPRHAKGRVVPRPIRPPVTRVAAVLLATTLATPALAEPEVWLRHGTTSWSQGAVTFSRMCPLNQPVVFDPTVAGGSHGPDILTNIQVQARNVGEEGSDTDPAMLLDVLLTVPSSPGVTSHALRNGLFSQAPEGPEITVERGPDTWPDIVAVGLDCAEPGRQVTVTATITGTRPLN